MFRLLLFIFLTLPLYCSSQIITTFAGNGTNTNTGDGGPAIFAGMPSPAGITIDKNGNYYVCLSDKIRKIDVNGIISTIAGTITGGYNGDGGLADTSKIHGPKSLAIDSIGDIFIADQLNHRVRKINIFTGIIITIAGNGIGGYNGDNIPANSAQLFAPADLCFDKQGNLYISEVSGNRIRKIDVDGIITTVAGNGISGNTGDGGVAINAQITAPWGIAVDSADNLYLVSQETSTASNVRKVDILTGIITTVAGSGSPTYNGDNIPAISANMSVSRIAFDRYNDMYLIDSWNHRVRKVNASGMISTVAGNGDNNYSGDGGVSTLAGLSNPTDIAFDSCNNLYITEQARIRKVDFNPNCWPVSVNEQAALSFNLYPNPANENITITGNNLQNITVTNALGQIVHRQKATQEKTAVDISALNAGVYFVTVTDKQGVKVTKKVVKE